ncbi:hypothetical protein [Yunchengibacter salinarum]|uniref:hypothetical protein n=1 Tax=Yunchengibacter salinarum TaxID=3133399 RepID=UPI0035B69540
MAQRQDSFIPPALGPEEGQGEPGFPKAAVAYVDALLAIQRRQMEAELGGLEHMGLVGTDRAQVLANPGGALHIMAESDEFAGGGWSALKRTLTGRHYRWMRRLGAVLLAAELSTGAPLIISGPKIPKRAWLKDMTVWIDAHQVTGKARRHLGGGWSFSGQVPRLPRTGRHYHILRIKMPGVTRVDKSEEDGFASLALSDIRIG